MTKPLIHRQQDQELPTKVRIVFLNIDADHQQGAQEAKRMTTDAKQQMAISPALVMTDNEARAIVEKLMYAAWIGRNSFSFKLSRKYYYLEPTDVIKLVDAATGIVYTVRITREMASRNGMTEYEGVAEGAPVYVQSMPTSPSAVPTQAPVLFSATNVQVLDIPALSIDGANMGLYVAMGGVGATWTGATLYVSLDGGVTYSASTAAATGATAALIGTANNALGTWFGGGVDTTNTVSVTLPYGTLSSVTTAQIAAGVNAAAIRSRSDWEIIQFQTAVLTTGNTYRLSNITRGKEGTISLAPYHAAGDTFVLLDQATTLRISVPNFELGQNMSYRAVPPGSPLSSATPYTIIPRGVSLKPYPPDTLAGTKAASGDWTLTWHKVDPILGPWINNSGTPTPTIPELYSVEITDSSYFTVKHVFSGLSTPTVIYTAAQQAADFGAQQTLIYFRVYQVSTLVGRSYPAIGTTYTAPVQTPAAAPTTWSTADRNENIILSNGGNSATTGYSMGPGYATGRSNTSHATAKVYFEATLIGNVQGVSVGLATSAVGYSSDIGYHGSDSVAFYSGRVYEYFSIGVVAYPVAATPLCFAIDLTAKLLWVKNAGSTWNNDPTADPATGAGGLLFSIAGPYFIAVSANVGSAGATINATGGFVNAAPTGFEAWGTYATVTTAPAYNPNILGCAHLFDIGNGVADNAFVQLPAVGFPFKVGGQNLATTPWYVGSNSYLTVGYSSVSPTPTASFGSAFMMNAGDRSYERIYAGMENGNFRVRFQGGTDPFVVANVPTFTWEATFYPDGTIQIAMGQQAPAITGLSGYTDSSGTLKAAFSGAAETTWYLTPADANGSNWSIAPGPRGTTAPSVLTPAGAGHPFDGVTETVTATEVSTGTLPTVFLVDSSTSAKTITLESGAVQSSTFSKFGMYSLGLLTGTGRAASIPNSPDWDFGAGTFTIEAQVRFAIVQSNSSIVCQWGSSGASWAFYLSGGTLFWRFYDSGGTLHDVSFAFTPITTAYQHFAVDRDSAGTIRVYVDGVVKASSVFAQTMSTSAQPVKIGVVQGFEGSFDLNGYVNEVRITKGVARYAGAFTPPIARFGNTVAADPSFASVVLLAHFEDA